MHLKAWQKRSIWPVTKESFYCFCGGNILPHTTQVQERKEQISGKTKEKK